MEKKIFRILKAIPDNKIPKKAMPEVQLKEAIEKDTSDFSYARFKAAINMLVDNGFVERKGFIRGDLIILL